MIGSWHIALGSDFGGIDFSKLGGGAGPGDDDVEDEDDDEDDDMPPLEGDEEAEEEEKKWSWTGEALITAVVSSNI